ncbi:nickel ABC transporter permease [Lysinibacillus sp. SGAir0095]|uniref:nickel ABC transporter permease n=1 Tax=Lysinibacillus sp. SGAir0095 TaxID=2070463 RepID=UPI0010CCB614|nr:nickel ABC transporter permease [Lysinibacillus sp. SGAir0095]QCR31272.1 ABC transporter permease [Lysinibacillus sp. SGAir0095]
MAQYFIKRFFSMTIAMVGLTLIAFFLMRIMPGDPIESYYLANNIPVTEEILEQARVEQGLDQPLLTQYVTWLGGVLKFDFGISFMNGKAVSEELLTYFSVTIQLALVAFLFILMICIPIGVLSAVKRHSIFDNLTRITIFFVASMPSFWLGFVLIYIFAFKFNLFPLMGWGTADAIILPALTLALANVPFYVRMIRTNMIEQMDKPFVAFARARGIIESVIIRKHIFKATLTPFITSLAMTLGVLIGGAAIVEIIFSIPGMGRFIVDAITARDYNVMQGFILMIGFFYIIVNFLADIICALIDPRIRLKEKVS